MAFWRKWIAILWPFAVFVHVAFGAGRMLFGCDALDMFSVCYFSSNARPQYIAETIGNVYAVCWVHRAWMTLKGKNNTKFSSSNIPCIHDELYFPTEFRAAIWHALINYGPCSYSMCDLIKLNSAKFWTFFFFLLDNNFHVGFQYSMAFAQWKWLTWRRRRVHSMLSRMRVSCETLENAACGIKKYSRNNRNIHQMIHLFAVCCCCCCVKITSHMST